jgi:hypothetical protein
MISPRRYMGETVLLYAQNDSMEVLDSRSRIKYGTSFAGMTFFKRGFAPSRWDYSLMD